jgi:N-acetylmuramoyl-L-alanine amidase
MRHGKTRLLLVCILAVLFVSSAQLLVPSGDVAGAASSDYQLLAHVIAGEARGEPYLGKVAVGAVVMNRVKSPLFPNTIAGVVYEPWAFTSVMDGQISLPPDPESYRAAQDALSGWDPTHGALYFYNPARTTSYWIYSRNVTTVIGRHYFAR